MEKCFISSNIEYSTDTKKYYKNGSVLKDEKSEDVCQKDFQNLIHKEVSNFICQNYSNIVALVGAGSSVRIEKGAIDPKYGKTMKMLTDLVYKELESDVSCFSLPELLELCKHDIKQDQLGDLETRLTPEFRLEDFLSDLLSCERYVSSGDLDKYNTSKNKIFNLIKENTSYDYVKGDLQHSVFINTIATLVKAPSKLTIVTTNYDTIIEDAADDLGYTVIDGFTFSHIPRFDSDMFEWNLVKDIENVKTKEMEYKKNIINLLKLHGSLTWERTGNNIIRKEKNQVIKPLMIFPSSNKYMQSYQEPYFELFTKFQEILKRPNTLLITTGFSFSDSHISQMVIQAIKHNRSLALLVCDFNISQENPNWGKLIELMHTNYRIAFLKATMNDDLTGFLSPYYDN